MPLLPYVTNHLPASPSGTEDVYPAELARAAAIVGINPWSMPLVRRPRLELLWRILMIHSSLRSGPTGWYRTLGYKRLDPSEKAAVSYFMGGVHAAVMTNRLFKVSHLVHYDAFPGALTRVSRPDFLGMDTKLGLNGVAVEAKGCSRSPRTKLIASALKQASAIPAIAGVALTRPMATFSYLTEAGRWRSRLEGPPTGPGSARARTRAAAIAPGGPTAVTVPSVLGYYYLPLVAALEPFWSLAVPEGAWFVGYLEDVDCSLWLPWFVINAFRNGTTGANRIELAGRRIGAALIQLGYLTGRRDLLEDGVIANELRQTAALLDQTDQLAAPASSPAVFQGDDFIRVEVGNSWLESADTQN